MHKRELDDAHQVLVQTADFDVQQIYQWLREINGGATGAIATFVGLVRDVVVAGEPTEAKVDTTHQKNEAVSTLTLEHYPGMTERSIEKIVAQAAERWEIQASYVVHRVGVLMPADQIVFVGVASAHRSDAFAATQFIMDYLKTDAVFWKKEAGEQGDRWIESTSEDHQRKQSWQS